jgi:chloramphenicol 3-O phosphotransferase
MDLSKGHKPAHIVILNGVGSVGKTATARAFQAIASKPFLHVAMDAFLDMLPEHMLDHPDGLTFETIQDQGKPCVVIKTGAVIERTMLGMCHAVAAMAAQGNNLIVDEVLIGRDKEIHYRTLLARYDVRWVGLFAPLDVLEARERARGDRAIGLARWQYGRVHHDRVYDLEIETTQATPLENARKICAAFGL